jgi:hypothetical protein
MSEPSTLLLFGTGIFGLVIGGNFRHVRRWLLGIKVVKVYKNHYGQVIRRIG